MTFFDKKEEVFHIELTPYGRYLLSIGKLMPHHYKFFDDDIVYDSNAMGSERDEEQSSAHNRIINETPKIKPNPNVSGVETGIDLLKTIPTIPSLEANGAVIGPDLQNNRFDPLDDNINFLQRELGAMKSNSENSIAFTVEMFRGNITGSSKFLNSQNTNCLNIPQINVEVVYECSIVDTPDASATTGVETVGSETYYSPNVYGDKVYAITPQNPIIRIKQDNSFDFNDNFEIKAFLVESGSNQYYRPLKFLPKTEKIVNGLLVDAEEVIYSDEEITSNFVEYYFSIHVDKEIAEQDICNTIGDLQVRNIYLDEKINCPDSDSSATNITYDFYSSRVESSDLEDCD